MMMDLSVIIAWPRSPLPLTAVTPFGMWAGTFPHASMAAAIAMGRRKTLSSTDLALLVDQWGLYTIRNAKYDGCSMDRPRWPREAFERTAGLISEVILYVPEKLIMVVSPQGKKKTAKIKYTQMFIALWPESQSVLSSQGAVVEFSFAETLDKLLENLLELADRGSWLDDNLDAMCETEEEENEEEGEAVTGPYTQAQKKLQAIRAGDVKGAAAVQQLLEVMGGVEGMDQAAEIKWIGTPAEIFAGSIGYAASLRQWYRAYVAFLAAHNADEESDSDDDVEELELENTDDSPLSPKEQVDFIEIVSGLDEEAIGYSQLVEIVV